MKSNSYKKLLNNSLIFGISEIGSKGILLLMVPLYTFYLTQSEYGYVDIIQVTINLLVPILSLSISEAALRYVMDKKDISAVFTNCFYITCFSSLLTFLLFQGLSFFNFHNEILPYVCLIVILQQFQSLYTQFIRGIGKVNLFAINGLVLAVAMVTMNLLLIVWLKLGIEGYLLSIILSLLISIIYINLNVNTFKYIENSKFSLKINKMLLNYSLPLMPNQVMWWIINASSRYFILIFAGASFNGLFAVASKIPSVLSIFNSIFFKAWQLSAIEEYESKNKVSFYSNTFHYLQQFLFIIITIILFLLKPIFNYAFESDYYSAWIYVPFLLVGVLFSSFSSFLGTNYIANKETKGVFKTSLIGGATNLLLCLITIPFIGVIGASISSMVSFIVMTIIRWKDTRKYVDMEYNYKNISVNLILVFLNIGILYMNLDLLIEISAQLLILLLVIGNNIGVMKIALKLVKSKGKK